MMCRPATRGLAGGFLADHLGIVFSFRWTGAALAAAVMGFPLMVRSIRLSIEAIDRRLEAAASTLGASPAWGFTTVTLPLILPGVLVGWLYVLTLTFKDLSIPILLSHVGTDLLPVLIFGLFQSGELPRLCAMGVILTLTIAAFAVATRYLARRFSVKTSD